MQDWSFLLSSYFKTIFDMSQLPTLGAIVPNSAPSLAGYSGSPVAYKEPSFAQKLTMFGSLAGGLINPMLGAAIGAGGNILAQYLQNKYIKEANDLARSQFLEDRRHDEWYNSPVMQKLRLKEAGLSPADFVGSFETSSANSPTPQVPDLSFLADAGSRGIQGILDMQTFKQNKAQSEAQIKLLFAQAEEAYQRARTASERYDLENAGKRLQNSYLGKQIDKFQLDAFNSELDAEAKILANRLARETQKTAIELLSRQSEGVRLDNDMKTLDIKGKKYTLDNILPRQVVEMDDKHKLSEQQLINLGLQAGILSTENLKATAQYDAIVSDYEQYIKTLSERLNTDYNTAKLASKMSVLTYLMNQGNSMLGFLEGLSQFAMK